MDNSSPSVVFEALFFVAFALAEVVLKRHDSLVGLAEWREARRGVGTSVNKGLRNSQIQYGIGISSGSESRP